MNLSSASVGSSGLAYGCSVARRMVAGATSGRAFKKAGVADAVDASGEHATAGTGAAAATVQAAKH